MATGPCAFARTRGVLRSLASVALVLAATAAALPAAAQPSECNVFVDADAYLDESDPGTAFGSEEQLLGRELPGDRQRPVLRYDLSAIPPGSTIVSATVWTWVLDADPAGSVAVHRVTRSWTESNARWNNLATDFDPTPAAAFTAASEGWHSFDLTALVADWHDGTQSNDGVMLFVPSSGVQSEYASREHGDITRRPCMVVAATPPGGATISGTVLEDPNGDGVVVDGVPVAGVTVRVYLDDGDDVPDAGDVLIGTDTTDGGGAYSLTGLSAGKLWVAADSRTVAPTGGLNGPLTALDAWADQTYGGEGALCDDGAGGTQSLGTAGSCFGGRDADQSDNTAGLATSEHVSGRFVSWTPESGLDFGFSFSVVTNVRDGDDDASVRRSVQGSLRQWIDNANALSGVQATEFRLAAGSPGLGGGVWTIRPLTELPALKDPSRVDGATQPGFTGTPLVRLDGSLDPSKGNGLTVEGGGSLVRALNIVHFGGNGLVLAGASGNAVQRSIIGVDPAGAAAMPNDLDGILIDGSSDNVIGGSAGEANRIAFNDGNGVGVEGGGTGNAIRFNRIHDNSLGIDLDGDGHTPNDALLDADLGSNQRQNYPVLASVEIYKGQVTYSGQLVSRIGTFTLDFYENPAVDPSGWGEGQSHRHSASVGPAVTGVMDFSVSHPGSMPGGRAVTATATDAGGNTSEFSAAVLSLVRADISGTVYEDVDGDADLADGVGRPDVVVSLYRDGGDGVPDGGDDTPVASQTTLADGSYTFTRVDEGTYWVVADSRDVGTAAGLNGGFADGATWAEQTHGGPGAHCDDGTGAVTVRGTAGRCYGGRRAVVSDDASSLTTAEHVIGVTLGAADASGIDFGFSFNTQVNLRDGGDDDPGEARTIQGSLRQFLTNANAIAGANAMRFVPTVPTNGSGAGGTWWTVAPTAKLPEVEDTGTAIDGTAWHHATGAVLDTHAAIPEQSTGPELSIVPTTGDAVLRITAPNATLRGLDLAQPAKFVLEVDGASTSGTTIEQCTIRDGDEEGLRVASGASGIQVLDNVIRDNGGNDRPGVRLDSATDVTLRDNQIVANAGFGIVLESSSDSNLIESNLIKGNGVGSSSRDAGIAIHNGSGNTIRQNSITANAGDGIVIEDPAANRIVENGIWDNGELAIDHGSLDAGDGVTPNDDPDDDGVTNFPQVLSAGASFTTTVGRARLQAAPGSYTVDLFASDSADPSGNGEARLYLGSEVVNVPAAGSIEFPFSVPLLVNPGNVVTATATSSANSTSEVGTPATVGTAVDLSLDMTVDRSSAFAGEAVTFTLTVGNAGPGNATGIEVTGPLPDGYTYVADDGGGAYVPGTGVWTVGSVASGGSSMLSITATLDTSGDRDNRAEITAAGEPDVDSTPGNGVGAGEDDEDTATVALLSAPSCNVAVDADSWLKQTGGGTDNRGNDDVLRSANDPGNHERPVLHYDLSGIPSGSTIHSATAWFYVTDEDDTGLPIEVHRMTAPWIESTVTWNSASTSFDPAVAASFVAPTADAQVAVDLTTLVSAWVAGSVANDGIMLISTSSGRDARFASREWSSAAGRPCLQVAFSGPVDLSLSKTVDTADPSVGANVVFTLQLDNAPGFDTATNVVVADSLPAGYVFVGSTGDGTYDDGAGTWTVPSLASGASATLAITATVQPTGPWENQAEVVAADQPDADDTYGDGAGEDFDSVEPSPKIADLRLTKTVDRAAVPPGDSVVFTLTLSNDGPASATGVQVEDMIRSGFGYVGDDGGGSYNALSGIWSVPAVPAGSSAELNITVTVFSGGNHDNDAEIVAADQHDPDSTPGNGFGNSEDDQDSLTVSPSPVGSCNVPVEADTWLEELAPTTNHGSDGSLDNRNEAGDNRRSMYRYDLSGIPGGSTIVSATGWVHMTNHDSTGLPINVHRVTATWNENSARWSNAATDFDPAVVESFTTPNAQLWVGLDLTSLVQDWVDGTHANNGIMLQSTSTGRTSKLTSKENNTVDERPCMEVVFAASGSIDLSLAKTVDDPTPSIGGNVVFTLELSNAPSFATATNVVVGDALPSGYTFVGAAGDGSYDDAAGQWSVPSLAGGATASIDITATVRPAGAYTNVAEVLSADQPEFDDTYADGSGEDHDSAVVTPGFTISGVVFEDVDYGGGAGRDLAAAAAAAPSFTVRRPGATVELYDSTGTFVAATVTDAGGAYAFAGLPAAEYTVRVVNASVTSGRSGSDASEIGVQTYRIDGSGESAGTGASRIGGERPFDTDASANGGLATLGALQAPAGQYTQSIVDVDARGGSVANVDFGFNFDTIVNTRDDGQGTLRAVIRNANLLGDDAALAQTGQTAGLETTIFMIPGTADTLVRPVDINYNGSGKGEFSIALASALPPIVQPLALDATTQPGFGGDPLIELNGAAVAAGPAGVQVSTSGAVVRGLIVNRFPQHGLQIDTGSGNLVAGNWIGLRPDGATARANGESGIRVTSPGNTIGGRSAADRNVVSGNGEDGIRIEGGGGGTIVEGNHIGTDAGGTAGVANSGFGVAIFGGASDCVVGGIDPGAANVIAGNGRSGVAVSGDGSDRNAIRRNRIHGNGALAVDLGGDGVTLNENLDGDTGPNDELNYPVFDTAVEAGGTLTLTGWARPGSDMELYLADSDASGFGEGLIYLTTLVEGVGDADATSGSYGPGPVNGLTQGMDTTNRFAFSIPTPVGVGAGAVLAATATDAAGNTSEFGGQVTVAGPAPTGGVTGGVFEDPDADAFLIDGVGLDGVTVRLYPDDGDGLPDAGDGPVQSTTTAGGGVYSFSTLAPGTYWVVVDSTTVPPSAGFNASFAVGDAWAEQVYAVGGALCDDGAGGEAFQSASGPCYGGRSAAVSDAPGTLVGSQHVTRVAVGTGTALSVDFGFSFNAIVTTRDGDDDSHPARTVQGSVRQFLGNADAIAGANANRFVPVEPTNDSGPSGSWWTVTLAAILDPLADAETTFDGTAYDRTAPTTSLDTNAAVAESTTGPELVLDASIQGPGLDARGARTTIRGIGVVGAAGNEFTGSGLRLAGPGATGSSIDACTVWDSAHAGIRVEGGVTDVQVTNSVSRDNGRIEPNGDGIIFIQASDVTLAGNQLVGNAGFGIDTRLTGHDDNVITGNLIKDNGGGGTDQRSGILLRGDRNTVSGNTITGHPGDGITIVGGSGNTVSTNAIYSNGELGIDLGPANGGDGVTVNDDGDVDGGPNRSLNFPVIQASLLAGDLLLSGFSPPGAALEFFVSDSDASGFGEGQAYLLTRTEGSAADLDGGTGSYGPGTVNGLDQGAETTERFAFVISPAPVGVGIGTVLTATATDGAGNTSEFGGRVGVIGARVDLSLTKTVDVASPPVGSQVVFTLRLDNAAGFVEATNVVVSDPLPAGYSFDGATGDGSYDSGAGTWTVPSLPSGSSASLDLTVTVQATGSYDNVAEVVSADQADFDDTYGDGTGEDHATRTTTPGSQIDLSLGMSVDDPAPPVGATVVFTLTLGNAAGVSDATNVTVQASLPAGYTFVGAAGDGSYDAGSGNWSLSSLTAGTVAGLNLSARVLGSGAYTQVAEVTGADQSDADDTFGDGAGNDYASVTPTPSPRIDLALTKTVDNGSPAVGGNVTFTLQLDNAAGFSDATNVVVSDALPAGYAFVGASGGGSYDAGAGSWTLATLAAGAVASVDITATVQAAGPYQNVAEVVAADQPDVDDTYGDGAGEDHDTATTSPGGRSIGGQVYEDPDGDGDLSDAVGSSGVTVRLYLDDGNGTPDAPDGLLRTTTTSVAGSYAFAGIPDGDYWVAVDSVTVTPTAGFNGAFGPGAAWADQTHGGRGARCDDGGGSVAVLTAAGPCYGGRRAATSDAPASLAGSEHVTGVEVAGSDAADVDFGFAFGVIVHARDGDDDPDGNRYAQGGLRQFVQNADAIAGPDTSRFVPRVPTNDSGVGGAWWTVTLLSGLDALDDDGTVLDGTAYDTAVPAAVRETSAAVAEQTTGPELVVDAGAGGPGLDLRGTAIVVRRLGVVRSAGQGIFVDPGATGATIDSVTVRQSVEDGILFEHNAADGQVRDSVVRDNGTGRDESAGIHLDHTQRMTVIGNQVLGHPAFGIELKAGDTDDSLVSDNLVKNNGLVHPGWRAGIQVTGTRNVVRDNTVTGNSGAGIVAVGSEAGNTISRNATFANGGLGIDLGEDDAGDEDGVTPNDAGDADDGVNDRTNFPVLATAGIASGNLVLTGFSPAGAEIELFISDGDPSGFGEGQTFLTSLTEGSGGDTDPTSGSYGPGPVNGLNQGTDTAERFAFAIPVPAGVGPGSVLTATATDAVGSTSEFGGQVTVSAAVDLALTKSVDDPTPPVGTDVTFTLQLDNAAGSATATNVIVTDALPAGYAFVSATGDGTYDDASGSWTLASLAAGASANLDIVATVLAAGPYTNVAEVTAADQPDIDDTYGDGAGEDHDTATATPAAAVDLSLTKTVDNASPAVGGNVVFTLQLNNAAGLSDATNVVVADALPAGYSFVGASGDGTYDAGAGTWTLASLAAGAGASVDIAATVRSAGPYQNVAEVVAADQSDIDDTYGDGAGEDHDTATTTPAAAVDLSLTKTVDNASPAVGGSVVFTLQLDNAPGFSDATNIVVADALPAGYGFVGASGDGSYDAGAGTWTLASLAAGAGASVDITATVQAAGPYQNVAEVVAADQPDIDDTYGDGAGEDHDTATATPAAAVDLSLTKTVDNASPAVGGSVVFTLQLDNAPGFSAATNIVVADTLPAGYGFVGASGDGTYDAGAGTWTLASLAAGAGASVDITATVQAVGPYTNVAEVTAADQPDTDDTYGDGAGEDHDSVTPTPVPAVDLSLSIVVDNAVPGASDTVVFTLTLANATGFSDATNVAVAAPLPSGYSWSSDTGSGAYDPGTGQWTVPAVAAGSDVSLDVSATVLAAGAYVYTVEVVAADQPDADDPYANGAGDDFASVAVTPVGTDAVIDVTDQLLPGEPLTVTVTDADMNLDPGAVDTVQVQIVNDMTGETETLTLTETGPNTGVFSGSLTTTHGAGAGSDEDGVLVAEAGDVLTGTYTDPRTSSGGTAVMTASGTVLGGTDATIALPAAFDPGLALTITVTDADADLDPGVADTLTVTVVNDQTLETETVVLTETAASSGEFSGTLATTLAAGPGADGDGTLQALPGNTVTASYDDPLTATGGTQTVSARSIALVDAIVASKGAAPAEVTAGQAVAYTVRLANTDANAIPGVVASDLIPAGFKLVPDSARLARAGVDGQLGTSDDIVAPVAATGVRPVEFGPVDLAGGETVELRYVLRAGAGVVPGRYVNTVTPTLGGLDAGNAASAGVTVVADATFDRSTILGKVFRDADRDGLQSPGETGVHGARVALDDGTYALTDAHGRYHFPNVKPGQRLLKLDVASLAPGARGTGDPVRVVWVTPGLLARANFGVVVPPDEEATVGRPAETGLAVTAAAEPAPVTVIGSAEALSLLVNDRALTLPESKARLEYRSLAEVVQLAGDELAAPVRFHLDPATPDEVASWFLEVRNATGTPIRTFEGPGAPPPALEWDGRDAAGAVLASGAVYQYRLVVTHPDGDRTSSRLHLFGVNRNTLVSIELAGDAFETGQAVLSGRAKTALDEAARVLGEFPDEKILIEGHTDSVGPEDSNMALSQRRAEAAAAYLRSRHGFDEQRLVVRWFGEGRPIASNDLAEGRELNRRVELRAEGEQVETTAVVDEYRAEPTVRINGAEVPVGEQGRFRAVLEPGTGDVLEMELRSSAGRVARASLPLPTLSIREPAGLTILALGESAGACRDSAAGAERAVDTPPGPIVCRLTGRTEPGNAVELDGLPLVTAPDGGFSAELTLEQGENAWGVLVRNTEGFSRTATLAVTLSDRDEQGRSYVVREPIPNLTVRLPPTDARLASPMLHLGGSTDPGNSVSANGTELQVAADGTFEGSVELPTGASRLVVQATDPEGRVGAIEREVEVSPNQLFLLAFADAKVGQLSTDGAFEAAGLDADDDDLFVDGRLAFYLKGKIKGKYLITAAYDSRRDESEYLFRDLDDEDADRLLTNLDPDEFYPVYGDDSEVVYDVQSSGPLYLALEGETLSALVGNYPLALTDSELAAYQRTLYGARFAWQSASRTAEGVPDTQVVVFGADVEQAHVRDELRATGGSLYYLSHRDAIEGTEQVTLVVRDKHTGLVLSRTRQRQNVDYAFKHREGRLVFRRPVSSVERGGTLVEQNVLGGHPVFIQVDYETRLDSFDKTATGARVRQQLGDRFSVGATYVDDELEGGNYQLGGVDAEVKLSQHSRIVAEFADSEGADAVTYVSNDGGVTYTEVAMGGNQTGSAWKAAFDLDVGEWFDMPERFRVGLYVKELESGFISSGNLQEQDTRKSGLSADLQVTERDSVQVRHDRSELTDSTTAPAGAADESTTTSVAWAHGRDKWGVDVEYLDRQIDDTAGNTLQDQSYGAARYWHELNEKLRARVEYQQTLSGPDNDQARIGLSYQALERLSFEVEGTDGSVGSSAEVGAVLNLGEASLYLTEREVSDRAGDSSTTILGARSPIGESSQVYTEYQLEDRERERRAISLVGLQRQWEVARGLRILLSGESADVDAPSSPSKRTTFSAGLTYGGAGPFSATSKFELRRDDGVARREQFLTSNRLDFKLNDDFTLLAKYRYSRTEDRNTALAEARFEERSVGLAYRPVLHDRFNALARYTRLADLDPVAGARSLAVDRSMDVVSLETAFQVAPRFEWIAKGAARLQDERLGDGIPVESTLTLAIQRLNVKLRGPFDLGVEYRLLSESEGDTDRAGWLSEFSWRLRRHLRFGLGYNFTDFSDNEFSQNDYSVHGWFLRLQGMY